MLTETSPICDKESDTGHNSISGAAELQTQAATETAKGLAL